ncbi:MAG: hypothetical protein VB877_01495 [Pirellulaceae bacterium]
MNEPTNNPRLVYNESALLVFSGATYAHEGPEVTTDCPVCQEKRTSFSTELFAHSIWLLLSNAIMIAVGVIGLMMTSSIVIGLTLSWLA